MKISFIFPLLFACLPAFAETTCSTPNGPVGAGQAFTNEKGESCVCVLHVHGPSQTRWTSQSCTSKLSGNLVVDQEEE